MKFTFVFILAIFSFNSFAAGEKLLKISECSEAKISRLNHTEFYSGKDGNLKQKSVTTIKAITELQLTKCQNNKVINQKYEISKSQDYYLDFNAKDSLINKLSEELKSEMSKECKKQQKNLKSAISDSDSIEDCR